MKKSILLLFAGLLSSVFLYAQTPKAPYTSSKFEQLEQMLPTPNNYRTGSGAPGHEYWQQQADYKIEIELDDTRRRLVGKETITYHNNSPDKLTYLWLQLDQNRFRADSDNYNTQSIQLNDLGGLFGFTGWLRGARGDHGFNIIAVKDENGNPLPFTINKTMMRVDLPRTLSPKGDKFSFSVEWDFNIIDANAMGGRGGYEYFAGDGNYLYEMAQWFPRMCVYDDVDGWQHKQFLGRGEFALPFGDYEVAITVPDDHIVASTGVLQNPENVLSKEQLKRLEEAENASSPVLIVNQKEAEAAEKSKAKNSKTWIFKAENVRDFAWASSRKFIWDAMLIELAGKKVWAMSYYPKEGNPLWGQYSTEVVAHTLRVYSKYTIDYPYPVAISVHGPVFGMEYPMICFNGGRPEADGTVPPSTRNAMVSVIIHEVGHNFFPMIINSDERQWSWMDEGLNTFCQYLTEVEIPGKSWAAVDYPEQYPSRRGPAANIVPYMKGDPALLVPIMTNSEQIPNNQFGANAYGKPATALNILRETVMGKDLFDYSFKEYSQRWAFKHPMPADFFRTMEDASGVDLDWFWRGWFYETNPVEISLESVQVVNMQGGTAPANSAFDMLNVEASMLTEFYERAKISPEEQKIISDPSKKYYLLKFKNTGGLVMPVIIQVNYASGKSELIRVPAEIWRTDPYEVNKIIMSDEEAVSFIFDPFLETSDIETSNNSIPRGTEPSKFQEYKSGKTGN